MTIVLGFRLDGGIRLDGDSAEDSSIKVSGHSLLAH